ncbi:MAG: TolC family protein [Candidatus Zixiibacteriota bacterium]
MMRTDLSTLYRSLLLTLCLVSPGSLAWRNMAEAQATGAVVTDTVTQDQVIAQVLASNNRLAAMTFMEKASREKIGPAGAWDDPMLMLGVQNIPTNWKIKEDPMTMKMLGLSWQIPYAGDKGLARKAAQAEAEGYHADREDQVLLLVSAAKTAYADLYYRGQALNALAAQYELLDQLVASIRSKLEVNQAGQEDLLSAQTELWRLQSDLLMAEADLDKTKFDLNAMRGVGLERPIAALSPPPTDSIPMTADLWIAQAKDNNPQLKKLAAQSRSYQFSARSNRRMSWPMLNLSGAYGFRTGYDIGLHGESMGPRKNMITILGTISVPIFAWRSQRSMARSMDQMKASSDAEQVQAGREIEAKVRTLHLSALHGRQSIGLYANNIIPVSQNAYESALSGYKANRTSMTSVLNLALAVYRNKLAMYQLSFQLAQTMAELGQVIGRAEQPAGSDVRN